MATVARRTFIALIGGGAAWPVALRAQQRGKVRRVGVLMFGSESDPILRSWAASFQDGLQKLGWSEDRNLRVDRRFAADSSDMQIAARELMKSAPDLILVHSSPGVNAIRQLTKTIPVVFVAVGDPVANGFVSSIAHPQGNITGFTNLFPSIGGKWLELLKEAAPRIKQVSLLFNPDLQFGTTYFDTIEGTASQLAVQVVRSPYHSEADLEATANTAGPDAGLILLPPFDVYRPEFITLLKQKRLPAISHLNAFVSDGGLMSYGADNADLFRRAATYVDRIFHGEKPSDLPVQFPDKFDLALNLKTAKAMDLEMPVTLRALATEVIE